MAVAIIGGTITSTLLTLLVVPTFYDSIEIAKDNVKNRFRRRSEKWHPALAFAATGAEVLASFLLLRTLWNAVVWPYGFYKRRSRPLAPGEVSRMPGD